MNLECRLITNQLLYQLSYEGYKIKNAEKYYKEALTLPLYYSLSLTDQKKVIKILRKALETKENEK